MPIYCAAVEKIEDSVSPMFFCAAVSEGRRRSAAEDIRRVPQAGLSQKHKPLLRRGFIRHYSVLPQSFSMWHRNIPLKYTKYFRGSIPCYKEKSKW